MTPLLACFQFIFVTPTGEKQTILQQAPVQPERVIHLCEDALLGWTGNVCSHQLAQRDAVRHFINQKRISEMKNTQN